MMGQVIDYRDLYDQMKDMSAQYFTKGLMQFYKLFQWKVNDKRGDQ